MRDKNYSQKPESCVGLSQSVIFTRYTVRKVEFTLDTGRSRENSNTRVNINDRDRDNSIK